MNTPSRFRLIWHRYKGIQKATAFYQNSNLIIFEKCTYVSVSRSILYTVKTAFEPKTQKTFGEQRMHLRSLVWAFAVRILKIYGGGCTFSKLFNSLPTRVIY